MMANKTNKNSQLSAQPELDSSEVQPIRRDTDSDARGPVDFAALFNAIRDPLLVLDPRYIIVTANEAYLTASQTHESGVAGRSIFEVFPDSPANAAANAQANLRQSLQRVLASGETDTMPIQRYDIPRRGLLGADQDGQESATDAQAREAFAVRFWSPVNTPVFDDQGRIQYILHRAKDVTDYVRVQQANSAYTQRTLELEIETAERAGELDRLNVALRQAKAQRDIVLNSVGDAIIAVDHDWHITYLNSKAVERIGGDGKFLGQNIWDLYPEEKDRPVGQRLQNAMEEGASMQFEHFNELNRRWTQNRVYPTGEGLVLFSTDVTRRKNSELHLQAMRARLGMAMRVAQLGFWEMDLATRQVYFSPECLQQLGYGEHEFPDDIHDWRGRVHPDDIAMVEQALAQAAQPDCSEWELEYRLRHKKGDYRWIYARFMLVEADGRPAKHLVVTHLDVTERKQSDERVLHSAHHDTLTDLPNRTLIYEFTERLITKRSATGEPFALLFLDLDRFKPINDLYGHKMGDRVLQLVAERLIASVRSADLVGRLAGDEFIVVLPNISAPADAGKVAEHILKLMIQPFQINGYELRISPSVGISIFPGDGMSVDGLIQSADAAMYRSKQSGRNTYHFYEPDHYRTTNQALDVEQRMRRSLACNEFKLFYQPILDTRTQAIVAVEALLRWFPDGMPAEGPDQFIPIAEATGLIRPLGDWVFQEACRQQQRWVAQGLARIPIAINVSPVQLLQRNFYDTLAAVIKETGVVPESLMIELTETAVMKDTAASAKILRKLKNLGLQIALDDFGAGYSSLSHLTTLPIDILKVDKSFTRDLQAENSRNIVQAILSLGRTLGLSLVAEGVQTQEAFEMIQELRCDRVQGHLFCEALPADQLADQFLRWQAWFRAGVPRPLR